MTNVLLKKLFLAAATAFAIASFAQPNTTIDLEKQKPEKYQSKKLNSEKTEDRKFGAIKHFLSNTTTHFNYHFNAMVKMNEVLERAKLAFTDDFTKLLPFYNYSLNTTASDKELDSVVYKCTAGILLHDLRNDFVDDLYLLLGQSYYLRKQYDSAYLVFQYLNYIYAPKDDGYDIPIGSNASNEQGIFTVVTNEKRSLLKKIFKKPIKRNDALLWLVRNYTQQDNTSKASGLVSILQNDPFVPSRIKTDLNEVVAFNYYTAQQYDSAAVNLLKALPNAENRGEKSRWEFLCGQLFQLANKEDEAAKIYKKAIAHSTNPIVDVYANLNMAGMFPELKEGNKNAAKVDVSALDKLGRKGRYAAYRDIIYYAAGRVSVLQKKHDDAEIYLLKSINNSTDNKHQKSLSFLALADLKYLQKEYKKARSFYDSVDVKEIDSTDKARVVARKPALKIICNNIESVALQDSLQVLAKLSPKELQQVLRKIYKQYKKSKGEKEDAESFDFGSDNAAIAATTPVGFDIADSKEFYFNNDNLKTQGNKEFKARWGNRPNVDNWNRASAITFKIYADKKATKPDAKLVVKNTPKKGRQPIDNGAKADVTAPGMLGNPDDPNQQTIEDNKSSLSTIDNAEAEVGDNAIEDSVLTPESLYNSIPLTPEKIEASNNIILEALLKNAITFSDKMEDYPNAIATYEEILRRFPNNKHQEKIYFNLSYCYKKVNKTAKEDFYTNKLTTNFSDSKSTNIITTKKANAQEDAATKKYEEIYNTFLEGNYTQARQEKQIADSVYGDKYWNPQLSFIEAVFYIKEKNDNKAIDKLITIVNGNADPMLQDKAKRMIDVLKRRKEIEDYLSKLNDDGTFDSTKAKMLDSIAAIKIPADTNFVFDANAPHFVVLLLDKVDKVFFKEIVRDFTVFNRTNYANDSINILPTAINEKYTMVLIGIFGNAAKAVDYIDAAKPQTLKILPWLPLFKYSYSIISNNNLDIIKYNQSVEKYISFIKKIFPKKL
jgi:Tfp pilus assembly protein PilF